jgi:hypothetical protein
MVDERFSMQAFSELGLDTFEARELADLLANEILKEMHVVIKENFKEIVQKLKLTGHDLKIYEEIEPGVLAYRDDLGDEEKDPQSYHCFLRIAHDSFVSTGYAHLCQSED